MGTIKDYIQWRGDLEFWQDGFNVVDNLVLSCISYLQLDEIFSLESKEVFDIEEISKIYFDRIYDEKNFREGSILKDAPVVLKAIASTARYRNIKIRNYVSEIDLMRTLQFAAMEFLLPDGTSYVAYRGTDDTIVGWKEDFMLATAEVEAEKESVKYLNRIASENDRLLRVGGHSKGGHLAVYAVAKCDKVIRNRVLNIYSNDGPGFMKKVAESKSLIDVTTKLISVVPEETVVGLLMQPVGKPVVVKSITKGLLQHNLATWCIEGKKLVTTKDVSKVSKVLDATIKENISKMSNQEIDEFVEKLFSVFEATGAITLNELKKSGIKGLHAISQKVIDTKWKL